MYDTIISYETAQLAKEKGFNEVTSVFFNSFYPNGVDNFNELTNYDKTDKVVYKRKDFCSLPTQSHLQKWLREEHRLSVCVDFRHTESCKVDGINSVYYDVNIYRLMGGDALKIHKICEVSDIYEQTLEAGLYQALLKVIN